MWGGVLPPRDSKKQAERLTKRWGRDPETQRHRPRGSTDSKMGETVGRQDKRRRDTASEMGRQTQLERRRQRAGGPGLPPTPPPRPRHSRQGPASPPFLPPGCARPGTVRPCPGSGRGSWGVDWAQGEGPPPSDNLPFWPPFWVLHLLRVPEMPPRLSWHSLLSQSLPTPSPCSSSASGSLPWRKRAFIKLLVFAKQSPHTASGPHTLSLS